MKRILVAIEDLQSITTASKPIRYVLELANAFSSRVWLLHVVPEPRPAPFSVDPALLRASAADELHGEHRHLFQLAQCLRVRGADACAVLVEGSVIETVLEKASQFEADLVVLVCRKHGSLFGALTGSPRERVLTNCPRPILFVPET